MFEEDQQNVSAFDELLSIDVHNHVLCLEKPISFILDRNDLEKNALQYSVPVRDLVF